VCASASSADHLADLQENLSGIISSTLAQELVIFCADCPNSADELAYGTSAPVDTSYLELAIRKLRRLMPKASSLQFPAQPRAHVYTESVGTVRISERPHGNAYYASIFVNNFTEFTDIFYFFDRFHHFARRSFIFSLIILIGN
jgi:hypothetical protein